MLVKRATGLFLMALLLTGAVGALVAAQETHEKKIKPVPMPNSSPTSGAQMYKDYCAACHGPEGKGDGPAAELLKAPPPDLTTLARRNNGKYPADKVAATLRLGPGTHAHGTTEMPVWGRLFSAPPGNPNLVELRIRNLREYIRTLQQK